MPQVVVGIILADGRDVAHLVQGYIPKPQYEAWLKQKWFGIDVPVSFDGYNAPGEYFPYWSAPPFTKAVALLALSKMDRLGSC
jgi:hypothetical protein